MIDAGFPELDKFAQHEIDTYRYLANNLVSIPGVSQEACGEFWAAASSMKQVMQGSKKAKSTFEFRADIQTQANDDSKDRVYTLFCGGLIEPNDDASLIERTTYYFAVLEPEGRKFRIVRKIHFDYDSSARPSRKKRHPVFHMQYGGKLSSRLERLGIIDYDKIICPVLSIPRIPCTPLSTCLLVDRMLRDFHNEETDNFVKEDQWKALLNKSEELLIRPFCENIMKKRPKGITIAHYYNGNHPQ